jgi:hypothetical protein
MAELDLYEVPHRNRTAVFKLTADEAESVYGDQAKKVGSVKPAEPQPVTRPSWAVDEDQDEAKPASGDAGEKQAAPARNKARHTK